MDVTVTVDHGDAMQAALALQVQADQFTREGTARGARAASILLRVARQMRAACVRPGPVTATPVYIGKYSL